MRVLLVDDEPAAVRGLRLLLEMDGFSVVATESPRVALEHIASEAFDVVVTDLEMPEIHGTEIVRAVVARAPATRVFVVTAFSGSDASRDALASGASGIFGKPLDYDLLAAKIRAV